MVVLALVAIVYGADFLKKMAFNEIQNTPVRIWKNNLIRDLSYKTKKSQAEVRSILDERYSVKSKAKDLKENTIKFFKPSKSQENAEISVNDTIIDKVKIRDIPDNYLLENKINEEINDSFNNIRLELHAQDKDRDASGWAAIPVGIHNKRLRMKLFDAATTEQLWGKDEIIGDIILVSKRVGLDYEPREIHLLKIHD